MKRFYRLSLLSFIILFNSSAFTILHTQDDFIQESKLRRIKILNKLDSTSVIAMKANDLKMRSGDTEYLYRQESNFFYLTGITKPDHYLIIIPAGIIIDNKKVSIISFIPNLKKDSVYVNGKVYEAYINSNKFNEVLKAALKNTRSLYVNSPDVLFTNDWLNNKSIFIEINSRKALESNYQGLKVKSADRLISPLREIKSAAEIETIQRAINITAKGIENAMKICKPGKRECELRAEIEYEMIRNGAYYPAFPSVIGSGENSLVIHYSEDNRKMNDGDVVVMDVGAEYNGYAADITRTIPVNGKFTRGQKDLYNAVLETQKEVIKIIKPGVTFNDLTKKADDIIKKKGFGEYIKHSVSHPLGIDVHDFSSTDTLRTGMVITVEPGIYIPKDAKDISENNKGFGIRIEDDVLVTETGCKILSAGIPKEVEEIEELTGK